jgi:predicted XRE-type DNA-binding protein
MTDEPFEIVRGSGNVFADFSYANADVEHLKATLAAEIIGVLDDCAFSVRKAENLTGIAAADFSRIRQAKLDRFTIDRLMTILNRLDQDVNVKIIVRPRQDNATQQICISPFLGS